MWIHYRNVVVWCSKFGSLEGSFFIRLPYHFGGPYNPNLENWPCANMQDTSKSLPTFLA